jgi:hypothetical protein
VVAADSGFLTAVADSVAQNLRTADLTLERWIAAPGEWMTRLMPPVLARARARLGVRAELDSASQARMARSLASRVAEVRWGVEADDDLRVRTDADVSAAVAAFGRLEAMLGRR